VTLIDLTTKVDVKATLNWTGTDEDTLIDELIHEVSKEAEEYLGRWLHVELRTEVFTLWPNRTWLSLRGWPITSITSLKYARTEDFSSVDALASDTYSMRSNLGQIRFQVGAIAAQYNPGFVQAIYTGGLGLDTAAIKTNEPALSEAARREVTNRFNRRKNPEGNVQGFGAGVAFQDAIKSLAIFHTALDRRRRVRL
jgi:hypothetical protein